MKNPIARLIAEHAELEAANFPEEAVASSSFGRAYRAAEAAGATAEELDEMDSCPIEGMSAKSLQARGVRVSIARAYLAALAGRK